MPRLRHRVSGVVVNVSDDTAARLGSAYESADEKPAAKKAPAKKSSKSEK
jgi:hypothetical protein